MMEMLTTKIKELYPQALKSQAPLSSEEFLNLYLEEQWLCIPKKDLTLKEQALLKLWLKEQKRQVKVEPWQAYLSELSSQVPLDEGEVRFVLYQVQVGVDFKFTDWTTAFAEMFTVPVLANVMLTPNSGVIVEKRANYNYNVADFKGIWETLALDFDAKGQIYVGEFNDVAILKNDLRQVFNEEQQIFKASQRGGVSTLATTALRYFGKERAQKSLVLRPLKQQISEQKNLRELIVALYQAQGNMTLAAKKLYVHRNTLQYQVEKFEKSSGLNLKNMDDLVLCYLVVL